MSVYKKKNRWYLDYYSPVVGRKREVVSIPGVDPSKITLRDAQKALAIRKAEIAEGKFNIAKTERKVPFTKLSERFLEYSNTNKKSYVRDITSIKYLNEYFGNKSLQQINAWHVEQYKSNRKKQPTRYGRPPSNATVNRELACLKTMFRKAIEWKLTSDNPTKDVKLFREDNVNLRILSKEEFLKLYNSSSDLLKDYLIVAINTGMRPIEISNLKWEHVNFNDGFISVINSKNGDSRNIPMNNGLRRNLDRMCSESKHEYIFSHEDGKPIKSVKQGFWSALRRSGINHCRIYDLRHTFASNLVMEGSDIVTVKELMGHRDINMTMRYSHPSPQHKKEAVSKLTVGNMDTYLDTSSNLDTNENDVTNRNH